MQEIDTDSYFNPDMPVYIAQKLKRSDCLVDLFCRSTGAFPDGRVV